MTTQTRDMPPLSIRAAFQPATLNREKRTVDLVWTTGARVKRGFWDPYWEELSLDPKHVRMGRLNNGAPFLRDHGSMWGGASIDDVLAVVESARLETTQGVATVRFPTEGKDRRADEVFDKIEEGILQNVSVGYRVHKLVKVEESEGGIPVMRAEDWEPFEISAVAMGADDGAGFRAAPATTHNPCEFITRGLEPQKANRIMDPETSSPQTDAEKRGAEQERQRAAEVSKIAEIARKQGLSDEFLRTLVAKNPTAEFARAAVLDELAMRSEATPTFGQQRSDEMPRVIRGSGISVGASHDGLDERIRNMAEALASRAGSPGKLSEPARQYARLSLVDCARHCLELRGINTRFLNASQIIQRGLHSTSDFAGLLQETGNRELLAGYSAYPSSIRTVSRRTTAPDFRMKHSLRLGEAPELLLLGEGGEVKHGTMAESKESYRLRTFARIFGMTRQAMINDDLSAFDLIRRWGRAAAELEATQMVNLLRSNPTMADGVALVHASHKNLAAAGGVLEVSSLGAAVAALRTQKMLGSNIPLNVAARYLLVPAALELTALQVTTEINAATAEDVNPYASQILPVVDPRLDDFDPGAWYLFASPEDVPVLEHAHLDSAEGPEFTQEVGFEVEGTRFKCRLDFGCGAVGWEGVYKTPSGG